MTTEKMLLFGTFFLSIQCLNKKYLLKLKQNKQTKNNFVISFQMPVFVFSYYLTEFFHCTFSPAVKLTGKLLFTPFCFFFIWYGISPLQSQNIAFLHGFVYVFCMYSKDMY